MNPEVEAKELQEPLNLNAAHLDLGELKLPEWPGWLSQQGRPGTLHRVAPHNNNYEAGLRFITVMKQQIPCLFDSLLAPVIPWDQNQELPGYRELRYSVRVMGDDERDDTSSSAQGPLAASGGVVSSGHALLFATPGVTQCLWGRSVKSISPSFFPCQHRVSRLPLCPLWQKH